MFTAVDERGHLNDIFSPTFQRRVPKQGYNFCVRAKDPYTTIPSTSPGNTDRRTHTHTTFSLSKFPEIKKLIFLFTTIFFTSPPPFIPLILLMSVITQLNIAVSQLHNLNMGKVELFTG